MNIPLAQLHRDSAIDLFRLRQGRLAQDETAATSLGRFERLLPLNLHVLARCWSARREIILSAGWFC
jgi:hypothetical protein